MSGLADFLRQRQAEYEKQRKKWDEVLQNWLTTLDTFFAQVKEWLAEELAEGLIELDQDRITLNEEYLGKYEVPMLKIKALDEIIYLKPIGRLIIGAQGRVDIESFRGREILLYLSAEKGWVHLEENGKRNLVPLTKDHFIEILKGFLA